MLNLTPGQANTVVIYADTITNSDVSYGDYFLFGFQNTYSKQWAYVIPTYTVRNTRFIQFTITVTSVDIDDVEGGSVWLFTPGNWTYKLWNLTSPSLDPSTGDLIDQGQMYLEEYTPPEIVFVDYISNNEDALSVVYYSGDFVGCIINSYNSPYIVSNYEESSCDPLFVAGDGLLYITGTGELYINAA